LNVYSFETKIKSINELEWIDGKFTVMYQKDAIAIINPKKWCCRRIINLADLKKKLPNYQIPMY
jgi:glutamine cyclotransferase